MEEKKSPLLSKTLWLNGIIGVLALVWPSGAEYVASNPASVVFVFSAINFILRLVTKGAIKID